MDMFATFFRAGRHVAPVSRRARSGSAERILTCVPWLPVKIVCACSHKTIAARSPRTITMAESDPVAAHYRDMAYASHEAWIIQMWDAMNNQLYRKAQE